MNWQKHEVEQQVERDNYSGPKEKRKGKPREKLLGNSAW